jgi:hypothetical protein
VSDNDTSQQAGVILRSPLNCPGCGHKFEGAWLPGNTAADQTCPSCEHVFAATWKGFTFTPERSTRRAPAPPRRPHG